MTENVRGPGIGMAEILRGERGIGKDQVAVTVVTIVTGKGHPQEMMKSTVHQESQEVQYRSTFTFNYLGMMTVYKRYLIIPGYKWENEDVILITRSHNYTLQFVIIKTTVTLT